MNIKVRNIPKEGRKGTTKLENLPEFCITMYGADRKAREGLLEMLDGLGVVWWGSEASIFIALGSQDVLEGTNWVIFAPESWDITHSPISWCEKDTRYPKYSLDHFKNLVEDYLYEHQ